MRIGRRAFPSPLLVFFAITPVIGRWMLWWSRHLRHQIWRHVWAFGVRGYEWTIVHVLRRSL